MAYFPSAPSLTHWYLTHCSELYAALTLSLVHILVTVVANTVSKRYAYTPQSIQHGIELAWTWLPLIYLYLYILGTTGSSIVSPNGLEATAGNTSTDTRVQSSKWYWSSSSGSSVNIGTDTPHNPSSPEPTPAPGNKSGQSQADRHPIYILLATVTSVLLTTRDVILSLMIPTLDLETVPVPGRRYTPGYAEHLTNIADHRLSIYPSKRARFLDQYRALTSITQPIPSGYRAPSGHPLRVSIDERVAALQYEHRYDTFGAKTGHALQCTWPTDNPSDPIHLPDYIYTRHLRKDQITVWQLYGCTELVSANGSIPASRSCWYSYY